MALFLNYQKDQPVVHQYIGKSSWIWVEKHGTRVILFLQRVFERSEDASRGVAVPTDHLLDLPG
jgi:hypothetical protein